MLLRYTWLVTSPRNFGPCPTMLIEDRNERTTRSKSRVLAQPGCASPILLAPAVLASKF